MMDDPNPMNGRPPNNVPQGPDQPAYTIPGILNFIKHEWTRFEKERANWDAEKTELQAKIAFLEGERRGQENLKRDLVRRIKMLEYALKQERIKLHKLQYGKDLVFSEMKQPSFEGDSMAAIDPLTESSRNDSRQLLREEIGYTDALLDARASRVRHLRNLTGHQGESGDSTAAKKHSRTEASPKPGNIVYTAQPKQQQQQQQQQQKQQSPQAPAPLTPQETVTATEDDTGQHETVTVSVAVTESTAKPSDRPSSPPPHPAADEESLIQEAQESLEKSFEFLKDQDDSDSDSGSSADDESDEGSSSSRHKKPDMMETNVLSSAESGVVHDLDHETEDAMLEFTSVSTHNESDVLEADVSSESGPDAPPSYHIAVASQEAKNKEQEWGRGDLVKMQEKYTQHARRKKKISARPARTELERLKQYKNQDDEFSGFSNPNTSLLASRAKNSPEMEPYSRPKSPKQATGHPQYEKIEVSLGLGELDGLTIANEAPGGGVELPVDEVQKTWFGRYTMRSHFDAVTSVAFHPVESMLLTGSEDKTLKLWNLQRNGQTRRTAMIDVEPILTLRGHHGSVLCVGTATSGEVCFSADEFGEIRVWQLPIEISDPFDSYDAKIHQGILKGHTDAVWDLTVHKDRDLLATTSSDGTCKLWNWRLSQEPLLSTLTVDPDYGVPTSVDFVRSNPCQLIVSYSSSRAVVFDTETGQIVLELNSTLTSDNTQATQINKIRCHPTLPIAVTAHEDKYLRFFDLASGAVTHSMVAHGDAVTGIAIDPNGLYLLSSSHDGSLRFWNLDTKICVQDSITHRKRFDEAIFNVACHSCKPFFASAGADGIAKVFI